MVLLLAHPFYDALLAIHNVDGEEGHALWSINDPGTMVADFWQHV